MTMAKILISIPEHLVAKLRTYVPMRSRSKVIADLLEAEIMRREQDLFTRAQAVESKTYLNNEPSDWDAVVNDGLD
jgi:metal-responsive CopG/Arc/MetJ family transcriptional regulator